MATVLTQPPVIVITGISSGIGAAFVENSRHRSYQIVGLGRTDLKLEQPIKNYAFFPVDLTNYHHVNQIVTEIKRRFGRIDVLINNAGVGYRGVIEELSMPEIEAQFAINYFAPVNLIQQILPIMRGQNSGHIINVSSIGAIITTPTLGYYAASKAALQKTSAVLADEVSGFNLQVSTFLPGAVKSRFGKNMHGVQNFSQSPYQSIYTEWVNRFATFFQNRNTATEAATHLWYLVEHPQLQYLMTLRDKLLFYSSQWLPKFIHQRVFLDYFFSNEAN